jgi:enoyl-CoA hydratase/carnithine racemase
VDLFPAADVGGANDLAGRVRAATDREAAEQERLMKTRDFGEGVQAASERRAPRFAGR